MQKSPVVSAPPDNEPRPSANDRKRKRHGSASEPSQKTISQLFTVTESKAQTAPTCFENGKTLMGDLSPSGKRYKLPSTPPKPSAMPLDSMYNFPSLQPHNNVIDLTNSPGNTPPRWVPKQTFNSHLGAKKIVVKNLRAAPKTDPKQYFEQQWEKLDKALGAIFNNADKLPSSHEELYRSVQNVCNQGYAEILHTRLQAKATDYMMSEAKPLLENSIGKSSVQTLEVVLDAWAQWQAKFRTIRQLFMYLDRAYLLSQGKPTLENFEVSLFRSSVFEDAQLQNETLAGTFDVISAARIGTLDNEELVGKAIGLYHDLGVYTQIFEPRFMELLQKFAKEWSENAASEKSLSDYIKNAMELMEAELARGEAGGLPLTTRQDMVKTLEDLLIYRQRTKLTNEDEVADLLDENAVQDLKSLHNLLRKKDLTSLLRTPFEKWIDITGTSIVFDEKDSDNMVTKLLALKRQVDNIWDVSFHRDQELGHALRESFDAFMNKSKKTSATWNTDNSKPGEMIAKYVDMLLRGGSKAIPSALTKIASSKSTTTAEVEDNDEEDMDEEREVNNQLDQVLDLFRFVHGKAVFEAFYKKDLARRLLMNRSASADAERSMLTRLRTECGASFTSNLEQMFKDIELAREEMAAYKGSLSEKGLTPSIDLSVNTLSSAAWPSYPDIPVNIPMEVKAEIDAFERYYRLKHNGRRLAWKHALAHCQMKASFPRGKKEVIVSSFQAVVLLLFNGLGLDEQISYETLLAEAGLPAPELKRTLQSLACAKLRPLRKHPIGREINDTDTFSLNPNFSHEKYRVKINQVQLKETKEDNRETHERVHADRQFETQAAIVRIMKSQKRIAHNLLVAEVIEITKKRGVLSVNDIKKNIDRLIDKDYMEREDDNTYSYVA